MKKYKINVMKWNLEKYNTSPSYYEKFQILLLMENANTHLVSVFKDYLLFDDMTEFFKEYYISKDIYPRLKTIYDYYESSSYLFPNYTAIDEGKYIYRNIIRKQKLIDYLEDLEDKKKEKEEKRKNRKKQNQNEESSSYIELFDTKVYDNIRKETENDSKINELFCVENKENNDYDSFASIAKLTEMIKEKDKEINGGKKENNTNFSMNNNSNKKNNNNGSVKEHSYNLKNKNNGIGIETKIFVSRRININQPDNNNNNHKKKYLKKPENLSINNFINSNYSSSSNSAKKKINENSSGKFKNIIIDPSKSNDFNKNSQGNINKKINTTGNVISNKNGYKKNNIIINIINNNKNNNYQSNNNYYSNYTNNNTNNNTNENNVIKNNYFQNNTNNGTADNKNNNNNISNNNSSKSNNNINSHFKKTNNIIKNQISSKGLIVRNSNSNNSKKIIKRAKKEIKSKLLPFRMNTDIQPSESNMIQSLTERLKNQSQSTSMKKSTEQSKMQNILSPNPNDKKVNKRTKTEILGMKNDIILFGQQSENNNYNKSINRQILKNINITNSSKPRKEISLINKKICSYHFKTNSNSNNSKSKIKSKSKYIKHSSTNSQNLTGIGINKIGMLQIKEIIKKKGGVFPFNKTERTSRNHSKDKINKMVNHTTGKRNFKDNFSPKKSQELIYNKIHKSQNKNNNAIICSFLKNVNSNKKIKSTKFKNNNSNINYKSVNVIKDKNN